MESTFLVPTAPEVVSISSAPQSPGTIGERSEILRNVLRFSRLEFLRYSQTYSLSFTVINDLSQAYRNPVMLEDFSIISPRGKDSVAALRSYLRSMATAPREFLFVWPHSLRKCSRVQIAQELCKVIESVDPGKSSKGQDVCKMAASLLFLCSHSLDTTRQGGQWCSTSTFIRRYLTTLVEDVPCVAMGSMP
ncbi:hypothetical protein Pmani_015672 [Petrolisthes manimaculis]|uniref:Uncharacterized protein n=1 Tax=Petrolisthes manimaculis TaxID=1843537 RepID=A0AAE1U7G4_9EUCA|nr:hypothetical protein Pmani_015672 [Petrolisthes manimaculis]